MNLLGSGFIERKEYVHRCARMSLMHCTHMCTCIERKEYVHSVPSHGQLLHTHMRMHTQRCICIKADAPNPHSVLLERLSKASSRVVDTFLQWDDDKNCVIDVNEFGRGVRAIGTLGYT